MTGSRIEAALRRFFAPVAGFCLFLMMVLTFAEVVGRYFLATPVTGGEEIKAFLLGFTVFTALPLVTAAERHIAVRSLANLLKGRAAAAQRVVVRVGTAAGFAFIAVLLFLQAQSLAEDGTLSNYLDMPLAPPVYVFAALAAGAALVALALLAKGPSAGGGGAGPE